jgi:hypothetical protein
MVKKNARSNAKNKMTYPKELEQREYSVEEIQEIEPNDAVPDAHNLDISNEFSRSLGQAGRPTMSIEEAENGSVQNWDDAVRLGHDRNYIHTGSELEAQGMYPDPRESDD